MKMEIIGKSFGTFTNKQGTPIDFRTLYVKRPLKSGNGIICEGYTSEKISVTRCVNDDEILMLSVGDIIDITFNQYGHAEGVELC